MKEMLKFVMGCLSLWIFYISFAMISIADAAPASETASLYQAKGRRDPFVQLVSAGSVQRTGSLMAVEMPEDLIVEGIACDAEKGCIVIANGTVMKQGESVGSVKALKIQNDGATFLVNEAEVFKTIYQEEEKASGK